MLACLSWWGFILHYFMDLVSNAHCCAHPGSPGQRAVKRMCVCVCLLVSNIHCGHYYDNKDSHLQAGDFLVSAHPVDGAICIMLSDCPSICTYVRVCICTCTCILARAEAFPTDLPVLGVYLKHTCSRITSASSALGVLNDYALYKSTHSVTHWLAVNASTSGLPLFPLFLP